MIKGTDKISDFPEQFNALEGRVRSADRRNLKQNLFFAIIGFFAGFIIDIASSAVFEILKDFFGWSIYRIAISGVFGSILFISMITHMVLNIERTRNMSSLEFIKDYLRSFHRYYRRIKNS